MDVASAEGLRMHDTLGNRPAGGGAWGLPERYRTCRRNPELEERVVCVGDEEVAFADNIHSA